MKEQITLKTQNELKIISNPLRMKILKSYYSYGKAATVKQMAVYMNLVPANIHYHVKKLVEIGVLELNHTDQINGIIAKYYLPVAKSIKIEDEDNSLSPDCINEKEVIVSYLFDTAKGEFIECLRAKSHEENIMKLSYSSIKMTRNKFEEFRVKLEEFIESYSDDDNDEAKEYLLINGIIESEKE